MLNTYSDFVILILRLYRLKDLDIMKIQSIKSYQFTGTNQKASWLDRIHENTKNKADMTDSIVVPRTIFKGYLGIMTGTTLVTLGGLVNRAKHPKIFKSTMAAGLLTSLYGTWAFVRPFIIKDAKGVEKIKN